ncbi:MBL fold metallo-hydrolase [Streptomyces mobaraensis]|uniref:MBL fold metallo-hydrolase n=1 Tax=Streptomyces mobaraensis TaxID=35621 RepID=UPI001F042244|nr:MBL fold metallo-hydrolase [Streptomyces mobaraensis]
MLRDHFHVRDRPDATVFEDGAVFDLGGHAVTVVHLPGHTPGHSGFLIEPDGFLFVADIDLIRPVRTTETPAAASRTSRLPSGDAGRSVSAGTARV